MVPSTPTSSGVRTQAERRLVHTAPVANQASTR